MTRSPASAQRRRRSAAPLARDIGVMRSPEFGRRLAMAVAVGAALLVADAGYLAHHAARTYGVVTLGMSRAEVRYLVGPPRGTDADPLWRYRGAGAVNSFRFAADGTLDAASCTVTDPRGSCPDVLGVSIGTGEDDVWQQLGGPAAQTFPADGKLLDYPGLGALVLLRRGVVVAIEHRRADGPLRFLPHALQLLTP